MLSERTPGDLVRRVDVDQSFPRAGVWDNQGQRAMADSEIRVEPRSEIELSKNSLLAYAAGTQGKRIPSKFAHPAYDNEISMGNLTVTKSGALITPCMLLASRACTRLKACLCSDPTVRSHGSNIPCARRFGMDDRTVIKTRASTEPHSCHESRRVHATEGTPNCRVGGIPSKTSARAEPNRGNSKQNA